MWAVGTIKHLVLLVVGKNLRIHGGEVFRLNVSFVCFLGPEESFSGEGWDRSSDSSVHINFSLWSRRLLSNVSRLRIECVVIPNSAVLLLFHLLMYSKPPPKSCLLSKICLTLFIVVIAT